MNAVSSMSLQSFSPVVRIAGWSQCAVCAIECLHVLQSDASSAHSDLVDHSFHGPVGHLSRLARASGPIGLDAARAACRTGIFQCLGHATFDRPGIVLSEPGGSPLFAGGATGPERLAATFFGMIHPLTMFTAVVLGQAGFSVSKRLSDDRRKYRIAVICYTAALVVLLLAVPWPWLSYGRSLMP